MWLKKKVLKKLNIHFRNFIVEYNKQNELHTSYPVPESAIILSSKIAGNVRIGEHVRIKDCTIFGSNVQIGDYSSIEEDSSIHSEIGSVIIGKYCSIARKVEIQEINHHINRIATCYINSKIFDGDVKLDISSKGNIVIGHDVWIGAQSIILSGVTIGNGAIIGANSVVTKDIPSFSIAVGSPAKVVAYRFDETTRNKIESLNWWDWDIEKIKINKHLFQKDIVSVEDINEVFDT
jgi:acetyltransferase-like isoleucine patch superfamily enzyme